MEGGVDNPALQADAQGCAQEGCGRVARTLLRCNGATSMKLSARNALPGKGVAITKGATATHVKIEVGAETVVTAPTIDEAVDALALEVGKPESG
jgi:molybdopterin-binding protein